MDKLYMKVLDSIKKIDERELDYKDILFKDEIYLWQKDLVINYDEITKKLERQKHNQGRYKLMTRLVDHEGNLPLSNIDTIKKNNLRRNLPNFRKKYEWNNNIWLPNEIKRLEKLVKVHLLKSILEIKVKLGIDHFRFNIQDSQDSFDEDVSSKMMELNKLLLDLSQKDSNFNIDEYWTEFWNLIALDLGNRCERTGRDCQITWYHFIDPNINRKPWEKAEDLRLLALVSENEGFNWFKIAQELNSGRTPYQCILRYQRSLNKNLIKSSWTKQEDEKLLSAVESLGGFDFIELNKRSTSKWNFVANLLPGRTNQQCRTRYVRSLKKDLKHGSWSLYEDVRLQFAYFIYGNNSWTKISRHIKGRSDSKCRERYMNMLLPDIKKGKWSEEENKMLILAVNRFGPGNWSLIKNFVIGRTDADCSKQWEKLDPASSFQYDIIRATQKHMLPLSYKWIGLSRSNHKLLNAILSQNQGFSKNDFIQPKLSGSDFFVKPAQNILSIAQYLLSVYNNDFNSQNDVSDYSISQLIKQLEQNRTNNQLVDQILLKIQRSLINLIKRKY
ncbi:Myb-like DNA-binding domain protein [Cryptosporidium meleagridis]|uniref:Myb-like DNA-binding domain protein n=1 Tax=Cryptosporidium meleagridis TaxID=93969 RepID=A0A2P4YXG2_9CRYT|nr:Myb-like DNA-binding domain protein [Cryptosporidium meleagridis]